MEKFSLDAIAREQAKRAAAAPSGRSAETVYGGHEHVLRQTVIALTAGASLDEHESPGEATLQVLNGRVRLTAASVSWEGRAGDLLVIPAARHALHALEDSAILLTVSKKPLSRTTVAQLFFRYAGSRAWGARPRVRGSVPRIPGMDPFPGRRCWGRQRGVAAGP